MSDEKTPTPPQWDTFQRLCHNTRVVASDLSATIDGKRQNLPISSEFQFAAADPLCAQPVNHPGRFDAEIASCVVHGSIPQCIDGTFYRIICDFLFANRNGHDIWINDDGAVNAWRISNGVVDFKQKFVGPRASSWDERLGNHFGARIEIPTQETRESLTRFSPRATRMFSGGRRNLSLSASKVRRLIPSFLKANHSGVLPRRGPKPEDVRWFTSLKNHYWGHVSNHFEGDDSCIYIDTFLHDTDALGVFPTQHPELESAHNPGHRPPVGKFVRFKIDPTAETTEMEPPKIISDVAGEMARCDDRYNTKPYNHAFGSGGPTPRGFGAVLHIDIAAGTTKMWNAGPDVTVGEPCFVPRSADAPEADGFLVVSCRDHTTTLGSLVILDTRDITAGPVSMVMWSRTREGCSWDFQRNVVNTGLPTAAVKADTNDVPQTHDVIVIGAGFAGLTAARDLCLKGLSVLILEARDRIGGRTWTAKGQNDDYEMGGGWVHHLQPHVWSEMSRYGLTATEKSSGMEQDDPLKIDGNLQSMREAGASFAPLAAAFFDVDGHGGRTVIPQPTRPLLNHEAIAVWDISAEERINQMDVTEQEKGLLRIWMSISGLTDVSQIGFLSLLRLYALSGYNFQQYLEINGTFKIPGGTTALAEMIFAEFKGASLFNRHITSISSNTTSAIIQVKGGEGFSANHVICTVPVHCLADIEFLPALPPSVTSIKHYNLGGKLHVHSPNGAAKFFGITTPSRNACFGFTESASKTGGVNIVAFKSVHIEAPSRPPLTILDDALDDLKPRSVELGKINEYLWHDWRNVQFSKGAWPVYPAKVLSETLGSLMENRRVSRRLTLAGSDLAEGWVGYVDGAIEQGRRAAFAVADELGSQR
ncbi:hypothetical protein CBS470a_013565 [Colletotrichum nupharicola]|nr:hypothetical protein CBS470a_013565 [Colletotrichum nupharicola]